MIKTHQPEPSSGHLQQCAARGVPGQAAEALLSIYDIPGIDNEKGALLEKLCGGKRLLDFLLCAPNNYIDRRNTQLAGLPVGCVVTFPAVVKKHVKPYRAGRKPYKVLLTAAIGEIWLVFFHYSKAHLENVLQVGSNCVVSGKLEIRNGQVQITHPAHFTNKVNKFSEICVLEPQYSIVKGLHSKLIHRYVKAALRLIPEQQIEWLDPDLINENAWYGWRTSISKLHNPDNMVDVQKCRERLAYDELLVYHVVQILAMDQSKQGGVAVTGNGIYTKHVLAKLGFDLTPGQRKAIAHITRSQATSQRMTTLLQGDVGSGKTVVALFAMLNVVENHGQVALMVPTELLAEQHCAWIKSVLHGLNINTDILTGRTKDKVYVRDALANNEIQIIVGTHALFQEAVKFHNLQLIIIDEQQRFGVEQRMRLIDKGKSADVLYITATPIPRTMVQVLYGGMERITLPDKPKCRLPIRTSIIGVERLDEVCLRLKDMLAKKHKAYWICPYVEETEVTGISSVESRYAFLRDMYGSTVGIAHGSLAQTENDETMHAFHRGELRLLVATSVIEVGIDVQDATIIVIENPERFGLTQLHQLRGRVGRQAKQSYCILLHGNLSEIAKRKLQVLRSSQDGFYIAEQDLLLRGGGEILGYKQSGISTFKFADPNCFNTLSRAYSDACKMVSTEEGRKKASRLMQVYGLANPDISY